MNLRDWRHTENLSLAECAARFGMSGQNPAAKLSRWETGASRPDADEIERMESFTNGLVTANDHYQTRLAFLAKHQTKLTNPAAAVSRTESEAVR